MLPYKDNIEEATLTNTNFRKVLYTGTYMQLVVMCLQPKEEIGKEVHKTVDQFFRIEEGSAKFIINDTEIIANEDEVVIVPAGSQHNVINNSADKVLKLYTIYSPPNHPEGTVHRNKDEAEEAEKLQHQES